MTDKTWIKLDIMFLQLVALELNKVSVKEKKKTSGVGQGKKRILLLLCSIKTLPAL